MPPMVRLPRLASLLADPAAARLRHLTLDAPDSLAVVARSRHLTGLETIQLFGRHPVVTDDDAAAFLDNPALAGVKRLWLNCVDRNNLRLSAATEARLRERLGDGYALHTMPG